MFIKIAICHVTLLLVDIRSSLLEKLHSRATVTRVTVTENVVIISSVSNLISLTPVSSNESNVQSETHLQHFHSTSLMAYSKIRYEVASFVFGRLMWCSLVSVCVCRQRTRCWNTAESLLVFCAASLQSSVLLYCR